MRALRSGLCPPSAGSCSAHQPRPPDPDTEGDRQQVVDRDDGHHPGRTGEPVAVSSLSHWSLKLDGLDDL
jgi:hypothetical protein